MQLATLVSEVPHPHRFTYELKWDGYRILAVKVGDAVRLLTRNRKDYTGDLGDVAKAVASLRVHDCVIDGEVCALDERGVPSFQRLQNRGRLAPRLAYFVFDVLVVDGEDVRDEPIESRRRRLARVIGEQKRGGVITISEASDGDPKEILRIACSDGLEGIIAKKKGSAYRAGRGTAWLKVKCKLRQEFAIVGYTPLLETGKHMGGLVLALHHENDGFVFAGKVGTGFSDADRVALAKKLDAIRSNVPTAKNVPRLAGAVRYCKPKYVGEVEFSEWTESGSVRHPSFQGLRPDKKPEECVRERPVSPAEVQAAAQPTAPARGGKKDEARIDVGGISISHPSRVLNPMGITKLDLARYYEAVAPWMVPHVEDRPLTLVRWSERPIAGKSGIYLRHAKAWGPSQLRRVKIREKTKTGEYLIADTPEALIALAQLDILEIHTWNSVFSDLERPNRVVFDLDPGPNVSGDAVADAAHRICKTLASCGLESFAKTTGGKGLHVVVPLTPKAGWDECLAFTRGIARSVSSESVRKTSSPRCRRARGAERSSSTTCATIARARRWRRTRRACARGPRCRCRSRGRKSPARC